MALFGSSGIRGLANKEITPELALKVGLAVANPQQDEIESIIDELPTYPKIRITAEARTGVEEPYAKVEKLVRESL